MPVQGLDIILISIMIVSGLLAMLRGLTREMLSIMSWALAALVTLFAYQAFREDMRRLIDTQMLADAVLILSVFLISLILFSFLTISLSDRVLDSKVGAVDRSLGFVYGLVRGLILVVIAYLIVGQVYDQKDFPAWVKQARSLPVIVSVGEGIKSILPDNPESILKRGDRPATPAPEGDRT